MSDEKRFFSDGASRISAERERQVVEEEYTRGMDADLPAGSLAMAAACYAADEQIYVRDDHDEGVEFKDPWPWHGSFDKRPRDGNKPDYDELMDDFELRVSLLVKAGALIAAEIDRALFVRTSEAAAWDPSSGKK